MISDIEIPWVDVTEAVEPGSDGLARLGDWSVEWGFGTWERCGAILPVGDRVDGFGCDAICICHVGHEHPHIAANESWVNAEDRIVSASRRPQPQRLDPRRYQYPVIMNLYDTEDA